MIIPPLDFTTRQFDSSAPFKAIHYFDGGAAPNPGHSAAGMLTFTFSDAVAETFLSAKLKMGQGRWDMMARAESEAALSLLRYFVV